MTEEQENNIDNPLPHDLPYTAMEAIQAINRLLWADNVEDDDYADAQVVKSFLVGTLPNTPVQPKMSKNTPVMETTIEGAQKRIVDFIEFWSDNADFRCWEKDADLEYIAVFIDTVGDEMSAMTSAHNSLHERYVQALAAIDEWKDNFETVDMASARRLEEKDELKKEIDKLRAENEVLRIALDASLSSIHAANDNR